jgi:hypothetical protein
VGIVFYLLKYEIQEERTSEESVLIETFVHIVTSLNDLADCVLRYDLLKHASKEFLIYG